MRKLVAMIGYLTIAALSAQPGLHYPFWSIDPCDMPPNDSVDVDLDGIADLLITGHAEATDDAPGTGWCKRYVYTLPGATVLCAMDENLHRIPRAFAAGDTIPAFWNELQNHHLLQELDFVGTMITVAQWGYGDQRSEPVVEPELAAKVFLFQTFRNERVVIGSFTIAVEPDARMVRIVPGPVAGDVGPLILR